MPLKDADTFGRFGVLVVEDNQDDEALTLRALARLTLPLKVTTARDGKEAIRLLEGDLRSMGLDHAPRLVLLDLRLPRLSGLKVLECIRSNAKIASLPVVCLTSSDDLSVNGRAYGLGANSFVRKPVDYEEYMAIVAKTVDYWLTVNFWPA